MLKIGFFAAIGAGLLLSGCATTSPNAAFRQALPKDQRLDANDTADVKVEAAEGVFIDDYEKQRAGSEHPGKDRHPKIAESGFFWQA
jgi:hypothetical protein